MADWQPAAGRGEGEGTTTTTRKRYSGSIQQLNIAQAPAHDPAWQDMYVDQVEGQYQYDRNVQSGKYTDLEYGEDGQGRIVSTVFDTSTGQRRPYPTSHLQRRLLNERIDLRYKDGIIQGTVEPVEEARGPNYQVTRSEVVETVEVTPSGGQADGTASSTEPNDSETQGEQPVSEDDVKKDHKKVKILTAPEVDERNGEPIPGSGGFKYLDEDQIKELQDAGRIKPSHARAARKTLGIQQRAFEKGTWPPPEGGHAYDMDGNLLDVDGEYLPNADGTVQIPSGQTIAGTYGRDGADVRQVITPEVRGPRVAKGGAGVPATHKVKLYTKDPSWLTGILSPLLKTSNGIIFPYTPTININHSASYGTYDINQSVNQPHYYMMTPNISINVTAIFTANTAKEAEYLLAAMHFFRTATKSDFGAYSNGFRRADAGTPPPVLVFSGYGDEQFKNIPVVLRNVNFTLPEDVDYVSVTTQSAATVNLGAAFENAGNTAEQQTIFNAGAEGSIVDGDDETSIDIPEESSTVPSSMLFAFDLAPQYPPSQLRDEWNLGKYASGELLRRGYI